MLWTWRYKSEVEENKVMKVSLKWGKQFMVPDCVSVPCFMLLWSIYSCISRTDCGETVSSLQLFPKPYLSSSVSKSIGTNRPKQENLSCKEDFTPSHFVNRDKLSEHFEEKRLQSDGCNISFLGCINVISDTGYIKSWSTKNKTAHLALEICLLSSQLEHLLAIS